jgi:hypothetical protein
VLNRTKNNTTHSQSFPQNIHPTHTKVRQLFKLDGIQYPLIAQEEVPSGTMEVQVRVRALELGVEIETTIVAGSVGFTVAKQKVEPVERSFRHAHWHLVEFIRTVIGQCAALAGYICRFLCNLNISLLYSPIEPEEGGDKKVGEVVQPLSGWWMLEDGRKPLPRE